LQKNYNLKKLLTILILLSTLVSRAQNDTLPSQFHFSGNVGITNNGISIIPTFTLNAPAFNSSLSFSNGGKFSIDPDLRFTFDGRKGGALLWLRYKLVSSTKFKFNIGAHPAYNFALRTITENGKTSQITQARRFLAAELAPSYIVNKHFTFGLYYLTGHGLQKDGPISTHYVTFNTSFVNLPLGGDFAINLFPQVYYLKIDNEDGYYLSGGAGVVNKNSPFSVIGFFNKELHSNITGSKSLIWNLTLSYRFNNKYKRFK
jgi:hypothetical protein